MQMRNGQKIGGGAVSNFMPSNRRIYLFYNTCLAPKNSCKNAAKNREN